MTTAQKLTVDAHEIVRTLNLFCGHLGRTEIRALNCHGKYGAPFIASGYFDSANFRHAAHLVQHLDDMYKPSGFYFIFNDVSESIVSRYYNRFQERVRKTTTDNEIECRRWLMVDIDPPRASGIGSSDDEKSAATAQREEIHDWLKGNINEPIHCDSGNGWHLYCPIDLPNDNCSTDIVSGILKNLQKRWPMVDAGNSNAARITKLFGTIGRKGDNTPKRPYRQSRILYVPDYLQHGWTVQ